MKKLSVIFLMLFMGVSTANAAVNANPNGAANANPNAGIIDPLRGDLIAALQSGLTVAEILASYAGVNSPYAITEVIGALTEVAGPGSYNAILAETQIYAPSFVPVITEVIALYRTDIAQGAAANNVLVDPTLGLTATAAGQQPTPTATGPSAAAIAQANALIANLNNAGQQPTLIAVSP